MKRPSRTRTRWPVGFFGMLALVAVVEVGLSFQPLRFLETASLSWRLSVEAIPREAKRSEVACLGDSLVKIGVIPEVVREGSGLSTYNFAMAQAPSPATYFVFRRLIEAGGQPKALVIDFKPSLLAGGPKYGTRHWQTILSPRELFELAVDARSPPLFCEIALGRLLPSTRDRIEIRDSMMAAFRGEGTSNLATNRLALRNWGVNQGAHVNSSRSNFSGEVTAEVHKKVLSDSWKPHRINVLYLERLLALAESKSIPVYWVIPPLAPQLQDRREQSGVDAAYIAFVRSIQAKHPDLTVIDGRRSGYDDSTFADHTHLNGRGAIAFSHDLATIIARRSRAEHWVTLPRFRDGTSTVPIEDIEETKLAVEQGAIIR